MASRKKQNEDPVEGSRETIERELEKEEHSRTEPPDRTTDDDEGRIRARAYEIWEREGRPDRGHERHWHQAKKELQDEGRVLPHREE